MNLEPIKARRAQITQDGAWTHYLRRVFYQDAEYQSTHGSLPDLVNGDGKFANVRDAVFIANSPSDVDELVAEVERLREVIEGGSTTKPTHRGMVTGCTNPGHLHLADAQAALMKASRCTFETKEGE